MHLDIPPRDLHLMFSPCWELLTGGKRVAASEATPRGGYGQHPLAGANWWVCPCFSMWDYRECSKMVRCLRGNTWEMTWHIAQTLRHQFTSHVIFQVWCKFKFENGFWLSPLSHLVLKSKDGETVYNCLGTTWIYHMDVDITIHTHVVLMVKSYYILQLAVQGPRTAEGAEGVLGCAASHRNGDMVSNAGWEILGSLGCDMSGVIYNIWLVVWNILIIVP